MIELAKKWFGEQPLGFVDIGARGGVHPLVEPISPYVSVLGFEPDEEACHAINQKLGAWGPWRGSQCLPIALSSKTDCATLFRCATSTNDSLRPINRRFIDRYGMAKFAQTGETSLWTTTLDLLLEDSPEQGEFLKLDTQGTEWEVLSGARISLRETAAIYCEVEFAQLYQGQKLFADIEIFLRKYGFSFIGFDNMSYRSRTPWKGRERLLHADALFIKDPLEHEHMSVRQAQVAAMACLLCGYEDFAKEIMEKMGE